MASLPEEFCQGFKLISLSRWGHNTLKALVDFNERMSEITIPIFIAHGDDDQICHIDGSTKLEKTVSSKDKTFKVKSLAVLELINYCYLRVLRFGT